MQEESVNIDLNNLVEEEAPIFDQKIVDEINNDVTPPPYNTLGWSDYVMSQFLDDELECGRPVADGLFRVTQEVLGTIVDRKIIGFTPAESNNYYTATVHVRVSILLTNPTHPLYEMRKIVEQDGIAEVNPRNTPAPYHMHPSASAFTKAEAQALRKVLMLRRVVAADEVSPEDMVSEAEVYVPEVPVRNEQINVIDRVCKRANISVLDLINAGKMKYSFIEQMSEQAAQQIIKYVLEVQSDKKVCPVSVPYDSGWKEVNEKAKRGV